MSAFQDPVTSRPALRPTKPHIQCTMKFSFPGVKLLGREVYHSLPSSGEVKNRWTCTSTPLYAFTARIGALLFSIFYRIPDAAKPFYLMFSVVAITHSALHTTYYSDIKLYFIPNSLFIHHELHIISLFSYKVT